MSVRNSTVQGDATLVRLEPGTRAILARVPAVDENGTMGSTMPIADGGAIWVPTGSELLELDPQTGEVLSYFDLAVGGDLEVASDDSVWCLCGFGWNEIERLNPLTGTVDVTIHLDRSRSRWRSPSLRVRCGSSRTRGPSRVSPERTSRVQACGHSALRRPVLSL